MVQLLMETNVDGLISVLLLEAYDEWQLQHRYMQTEVMAELTSPLINAVPPQLSTITA